MSVPEPKTSLTWAEKQLLHICREGGVPKHVAFVMDGNRRFAKMTELPSVVEGHEKGFESLMFALEVCLELGVQIVTVYAFSEENFSRPKQEVDGLMRIAMEKFEEFVKAEERVMREGIIVDMWGRPELLPAEVQAAAARTVLGTRSNPGRARLNVCFAYSGTEEIAQALRTVALGLLQGKLRTSDIDDDLITRCTYLRDNPAPDLVVRTSGETRLSDFLLWHMRNTKLAFIDVLWPQLTSKQLLICIIDWQLSRQSGEGNNRDESSKRGTNARVEDFINCVEANRVNMWIKIKERHESAMLRALSSS